jgi:hypothetical protein
MKNRIPDHFTEFPEEIMSNLDRTIDFNVASAIIEKPLYAQYSGYDFCGYVWWEQGEWYCEVWQHKQYKDTFKNHVLGGIMLQVSEEYGSD